MYYYQKLMAPKTWRKWWRDYKKEYPEFIQYLRSQSKDSDSPQPIEAKEASSKVSQPKPKNKPAEDLHIKVSGPAKQNKDWLKLGQIWTVQDQAIQSSKTGQLPVVITDCNPHDIVEHEGEEYRQIKVAPIDYDLKFLGDGDLLVPVSEHNPLGQPFVIRLWNEQHMLSNELYEYKDEIPVEADFFIELVKDRGDQTTQQEILELAIRDKGKFDDPLWQFRLRSYLQLEHLRGQVINLQQEVIGKYSRSSTAH